MGATAHGRGGLSLGGLTSEDPRRDSPGKGPTPRAELQGEKAASSRSIPKAKPAPPRAARARRSSEISPFLLFAKSRRQSSQSMVLESLDSPQHELQRHPSKHNVLGADSQTRRQSMMSTSGQSHELGYGARRMSVQSVNSAMGAARRMSMQCVQSSRGGRGLTQLHDRRISVSQSTRRPSLSPFGESESRNISDALRLLRPDWGWDTGTSSEVHGATSSSPAEKSDAVSPRKSKSSIRLRGLAKLRSSLKERINRLEERNEAKMMRNKLERRKEALQAEFNALPLEEADLLERAFKLYDADDSKCLDYSELPGALKELGLEGQTGPEKNEIWEVCKKVIEDVPRRREEFFGEEDDLEVDFLTFAVGIVPKVREAVNQILGKELARHFALHDTEGTGQILPEKCLEIAGSMGMDEETVHRALQARGQKESDEEQPIDFDELHQMLVRVRQQSAIVLRERERRIEETENISPDIFNEFRQEIVSIYDTFSCYCTQDEDKEKHIRDERLLAALSDCGLLPKKKTELDQAVLVVYATFPKGYALCFKEFLQVVKQLRSFHRGLQRPDLLLTFEKYDKDKSGSLSISEVALMIYDLGMAPRSRYEQAELGSLLQAVDTDGSGSLDFDEFEDLAQRIEERLVSLRRHEEARYAERLGLASSLELHRVRTVFTQSDEEGTDFLDLTQAKNAARKLDKQVKGPEFSEAFHMLADEMDGVLKVSLPEFLQLLQNEGLYSNVSPDQQMQ